VSGKEMAPQVRQHPGTRPTETRRPTVDTNILPKDRPEVLPDEAPHGCYEGWVYLGFESEGESGEPVEVIERVPCRRCHDASETR
jgi:hypothetical protein